MLKHLFKLDGIIVTQPKCFLPLAQEARKIAEQIRIKIINEQWAGLPQEQLLNQSFNDHLNSIQILEQLAPLQLAKDHLPGDIIDILERLGKADNIPHNQLYYMAENCTNRYYSKVIEMFTLLLKLQFADRQLLLINTARSLKFLEEYTDRQALIWKIFSKHQNIPDEISDLHLHIDDFKGNIQKEFQTKSGHLTDLVKEAIDLFEHTLDKTVLVRFQTNKSKFKDLTMLKMMFLQRYNPWRKMKREQLQSWNILSFNPKTMDVDEHIDLINTLGDMVDQKEEAKKERFIETMPTMIQTHLIMCKDWDMVKDTAKSLEHIIMKCDPPTPAMPMMATGATVMGLYSHIAHLVDKEEGDIPQPFKGTKPNKPEVEENLKENLKIKDKTHQKPKRWKRIIIMKALTIITIILQTRV